MSRVARATGPRLRVLGSRGAFSIDGLDPQEAALRSGRSRPEEPGFGEVPAGAWGVLTDDSGSRRVPSERGRYAAFLEQVAQTLRTGAPAPVDVREAREVVAVIERAHALAAR